jgi:hypothetical protein
MALVILLTVLIALAAASLVWGTDSRVDGARWI